MSHPQLEKKPICRISLCVSLQSELPDHDSLYITGNLPELGDWDPAGKTMQKIDDGLYCINFEARKGSIVECKLTRGTWKTQGIYDSNDVPPSNLVIKANKNKEVKVEILDWLDHQVLETDPVVGRIISLPEFACHGLKYKRPVEIWLPDNYSETGDPSAVIYMHDGQNLFEPGSAFAGADWKVDETITRMIAAGEIRNCIVVGIPNSPDRMKELNLFTKEGKAYAEFIINEVKPLVEKNFNVAGDRDNTAIMGSSMGGLMSFQMLCAYPEIFGMAGCLSSAFQKTDGRIFSQIEKSSILPLNSRLYLDTGEYEPPIAESYFAMMHLLIDHGFIEGRNLMGFFDEGATHCEAAWARRLKVPLKFLLGKK